MLQSLQAEGRVFCLKMKMLKIVLAYYLLRYRDIE